MDKIGEVIGPKGKVINTIQQETGADISVDDDGAQGIVTIGAVEGWRMEEAKAAILAIVDPPKAEIGKTYKGRAVNITKFGAFVNILPGRDGLVHISKLGRGKRINAVEDVLNLGDEIDVTVEEIDDRGKVSLVPRAICPRHRATAPPKRRRPASSGGRSDGDVETVSFEASFDAELASEFGDLGPASERPVDDDRGGRNDRGSRDRDRGGRPGRSAPPLTRPFLSERIVQLPSGLTVAVEPMPSTRGVDRRLDRRRRPRRAR